MDNKLSRESGAIEFVRFWDSFPLLWWHFVAASVWGKPLHFGTAAPRAAIILTYAIRLASGPLELAILARS